MKRELVKLAIGLPSGGLNHSRCTLSLMAAILQFSGGIPSRPECDLEVLPMVLIGSTIHNNREQIVKAAIEAECTHLLFVDGDMEFTPGAVDSLFSRRHPIVVTSYAIKTFPVTFTAVSLNGQRCVTTEKSRGIEEIIYSGFGLSLFEVSALKAIKEPRFAPQWHEPTQSYTTEDLPCFEALRAAGYKVYLDHDASKKINHLGDFAYSWQHHRVPEKDVQCQQPAALSTAPSSPT